MDTGSLIIKLLTALLLGYFWYDKNKTDKDLESHKRNMEKQFHDTNKALTIVSNKQVEHDSKFVTDQRVRDIVKDEIKPLKEDVSSMKVNVAKIMESLQDLTIELRVHNALRDREVTRE